MVKLSSSLCSAGKSETGMCTSPNWMAPFQSSRGMFVFSSAARRRGVDQLGHASHRRTADVLARCRLAAGALARKLDRPAGARGFVERLDHPHVEQAFLAGRLGLAPARDAIREIHQLRGELVALAVLH